MTRVMKLLALLVLCVNCVLLAEESSDSRPHPLMRGRQFLGDRFVPAIPPAFPGDPSDHAVKPVDAEPAPSEQTSDSFVEHRPDIRPVIDVFTTIAPGQCGACDRFANWEKDNRDKFPLRFNFQKAPDGMSTPSFRWRDAAGKLWKPREDGWRGPESSTAILRDYRATIPGLKFDPEMAIRTGSKGVTEPAKEENLIAVIRRFAGPKGKLVFTPDQPISADVKGDGAAQLEFAEIRLRYDLAGERPTVTFEDPVPGGTYTAWGWGVGFKLHQVTYAPPPANEFLVGTNWKTITIRMSAGGDHD